ncbi:MAG: DUF2232 domain-containing protein [Candidatus Tenebribacter davisii]|nr:DUF2232 domain-containing protein [Candidatus Tenebribacter davisii]
MILIAVISVVIATVSPFWGLIFILAFSVKYQNNKKLFFSVYFGFAAILLIFGVLDVITAMDVLIGVGLSSFLYLWSLHRTLNYINAMISVVFLNIIYAVIRMIIFGKQFAETIAQVMDKYKEFVAQSFQNDSEQLSLALKFTESFQEIFTKYYMGIWVFTIVFSIYISSLIISKKGDLKLEHKKIRMPFYIIYFLIISLAGFLMPNFQIIGINALIMITPLFLIQGISVIDFYWGDFFRRSKILFFLLIFSLVFNYYILILVALVGLADIWLNFRKIDTEEINENYLN